MPRRPLARCWFSATPFLVLTACGDSAPVSGAALRTEVAAEPAAAVPATAAPAIAARPPDFAAYRETIGSSGVGFDLAPVDGGTFTMGSPANEPGRNDDEGPQLEVQLEPFWMGRCEVTWAEYDLWSTDDQRPQSKKPDGISRPTPAYMDMTLNMGRDGYPAICMSHVAARQYCKWLSEKTGHFYRLPTEAEWEYACRAGSKAAWSCGDEPQLDAIAWHAGNSGRVLEHGAKPVPAYHEVGRKQPNAFGLFDMHGNVAEWVADHYLADAYATAHGPAPRRTPYFAPGRDDKDRPIRFPHVARGGSFCDKPAVLRSAARLSSDPVWNMRDPQIPKSWWYLTDAQHIGFRVVRPYRDPPAAERARFENP